MVDCPIRHSWRFVVVLFYFIDASSTVIRDTVIDKLPSLLCPHLIACGWWTKNCWARNIIWLKSGNERTKFSPFLSSSAGNGVI